MAIRTMCPGCRSVSEVPNEYNGRKVQCQQCRQVYQVAEVDGNEAVKEAVLQGLGVAVLSRRSIQDEVLKGTVRAIPITGFSLTRSLYVVRNRRHPLSAAAQAFLTRFQFAPACAS